MKLFGVNNNGHIPKRIWLITLIAVLLAVGGAVLARHAYDSGLGPVSSSQQTQIFEVKKGDTAKQIGVNLENVHLIKSAWAFQIYVHSKNLNKKLQAGTYAFSPSDGTPEIVRILSKGRVSTRLVTIYPGQRIDQLLTSFINSGFKPAAVEKALNPATYADLPVMAIKPADVNSLEGMLWPDSFQKDPNTDPSYIIRQSLIEMDQHLTPDVKAAFKAEGLSTYQGLILASIVIQEVNKPVDQAQAAQVFLSRLNGGIALGSDVTTRYGSTRAGFAPSLDYDSPYNTHLHTGLPPTPISTINDSSLVAAAHPAATSWLFFVTGDDGVTHFSNTLEEHQALTKQYCHKLCGN